LTVLIIFLVVVTAVGIGFSLFEEVGDGLLNLQVPRFREGRFQPGTTALVDFLRYGFNLELVQIKRVISASLGALIGLGVFAAALLVWRSGRSSRFAVVLANSFLIAGFLLSPLLNMGAGRRDCEQDIIAAHERLGAYMDEIIPPDSLVYWDGGNAFTPMVYVLDARIFPPQINNGYTYHIGGDPDELYYFSHWNEELDLRWRGEADIFIIEGKRFWEWKDFLSPESFYEFDAPADAPSCVAGSELRIFQRTP
jgi:hypothetical protein